MSLVSIVATELFLCVVCDGRVMDHTKNPVKEDFKKFIVPCDGGVIAFAGGKEPSIEFIYQSGLASATKDDLTSVDFANKINKELIRSPLSAFKIMLAFGGIDSKGTIAFHTFSSLEPKVQRYTPVGNDISFAFLHNGENVDLDFGAALLDGFKSMGGLCSPDTTIKAQTMLNSRVAAIDDSVNDNTFSHVIIR